MIENHDLDRVIIIHNGMAYFPKASVIKKGFFRKDANAIIKAKQWDDAIVVSIKNEIKKYGLKGDPSYEALLDPECYEFEIWHQCYINRNINVTHLPIHISYNKEYMGRLDEELKIFQDAVSRPPFVYDTKLIKAIKSNCRCVQTVFDNLLHRKKDEAEKLLKELLETYLGEEFIVNTLDNSYSFRGLAPYGYLHSSLNTNYEEMMNEQLTFFRIRTKNKNVSKEEIRGIKDIVHIPYNLAARATEMRFSKAKEPCLYLGVTSFICAKEVRWDENTQELYGSVFVPNAKGLKLKILNLALSQYLINGMNAYSFDKDDEKNRCIQSGILKLYPLVVAMSFSISESDRNIKFEYLISQCLMKAMHEVGIDGIAYLSAQGEDEFQYPHGVNLALPAYDISDNNQYSKYCHMFEISKPVVLNNQSNENHRSYINKIYKRCYAGTSIENSSSKILVNDKRVFYGDTKYADYDNYLCSLERHNISMVLSR